MEKQSKSSEKSGVLGFFKALLIIVYLAVVLFYGYFIYQTTRAEDGGVYANLFGNYVVRTESALPEYELGKEAVIIFDEASLDGTVNFKEEDHNLVLYNVGGKEAAAMARVDALDEVMGTCRITDMPGGTESKEILIGEIAGIASTSIPGPLAGKIMGFLSTWYAILVIIVIPCGLFLILRIIRMIRTMKNDKEDEEFETFPKIAGAGNPSGPAKKSADNPLVDYTDVQNVSAPEDSGQPESTGFTYNKVPVENTQQILSNPKKRPKEDDPREDSYAKYGMDTKVLPDGLEVRIDGVRAKDITIKLNNDGSGILITTDEYQAEVNINDFK